MLRYIYVEKEEREEKKMKFLIIFFLISYVHIDLPHHFLHCGGKCLF
jgi:hypothetical protein